MTGIKINPVMDCMQIRMMNWVGLLGVTSASPRPRLWREGEGKIFKTYPHPVPPSAPTKYDYDATRSG